MKIFVIGSYLEETAEATQVNIDKAAEVGIEIMRRGHLPFVPQPMFAGWEAHVDMDQIMKTCFGWIEQCDAVYVLNIGSEGGGTWRALEHARKYDKLVYDSYEQIPSP